MANRIIKFLTEDLEVGEGIIPRFYTGRSNSDNNAPVVRGITRNFFTIDPMDAAGQDGLIPTWNRGTGSSPDTVYSSPFAYPARKQHYCARDPYWTGYVVNNGHEVPWARRNGEDWNTARLLLRGFYAMFIGYNGGPGAKISMYIQRREDPEFSLSEVLYAGGHDLQAPTGTNSSSIGPYHPLMAPIIWRPGDRFCLSVGVGLDGVSLVIRAAVERLPDLELPSEQQTTDAGPFY